MSARDVLAERGVTRKEAEVLDALGEHLTNAEIATRFYVSERTVESHVSSLLRKLAASNRHELVRVAAAMSDVRPIRQALLPATLELASESGPLVGRDDELDRLVHLWRRVTEGYSLVAVVTGEAGIGKSRLVAEFASSVRGLGGRVLLGACFEDLQLPYQPFVQAIAADLDGLPVDERRRRVAGDWAVLGRVLPVLGDGTAPGEIVDAPSERADLLGAVHDYLSRAARDTPLLLVIEDLHWATATTRDTVRHLARMTSRAPLLAVVTSRATPPDATDQLAELLSDLARAPSAHRIAIEGLDRSHVHDLLTTIGDAGGVDADVVYAATRGNPLFVKEMVASGGGPLALDASVRTLLAGRSRRLSDDDNALLDLGAVIGAEFGADLIAAAADTPLVDVLEALERAEAVGLINPTPSRAGRFVFVHPLFRSARYHAMATGRRLRFHQSVTSVLAPRAGDDRVVPALAHHACAAAPLGDPRAAIDFAARAGELAAHSLAFAEAAAQYRRALQVADLLDSPDLELRCELSTRLGETLSWAGDPDARTVLTGAAPVARRLGRPDLLAAIAWTLSPAFYGSPFFDDPFVLEVAEEALAGLKPEPSATQARLLAILGPQHRTSVDTDDRPGVRADAIEVARQLDDPVTLGQVLAAYQWSHRTPENLDERIAIADELDHLGERLGHLNFRQRSHAAQFWNLIELGHVAEAWQAAALNDAMVREHGRSAFTAALANRHATRLYLAGDLAAAEQATETLLTVAQTLAVAVGLDPMHYYVPHLAMIRFNQGRIGEAVSLIEAAITAHPNIVTYEAILALALARTGDLDAARTILRRLTDNRVAAIPRNWLWYTGMVALADVADLTGHLDAAAVLEERLHPYSGRLASHVTGVSIPIDIALAQLALARGDNQRAATIAAKAVHASRRMKTPIFLARALVQQAAAERRLGGHQDGTRPLNEAVVIAETSQAGLIQQEADRYGLT